MKFFKVLLALILSFFLICTQGMFMGFFACDKAFSEENISKAVQKTALTDELYREVLSAAGESMDPTSRLLLEKAMKTDTFSNFAKEYTSSALHAALYGSSLPDFTMKDLTRLTRDSLDELSEKTGIPVSNKQKQQMINYVKENGSNLVVQINEKMPVQEDITSFGGELAVLSYVQTALSQPVRILLAAATAISALLLLILFWRSRAGFLWWGSVSICLGGLFLLAGAGGELFISYLSSSGSIHLLQFFFDLFSKGALPVGGISLGLGIFLFLLFFLLRKKTAKAR